jgi:hypothetical protein
MLITNTKFEYRNPKQIQISNDKNSKLFQTFEFRILKLFRVSDFVFLILNVYNVNRPTVNDLKSPYQRGKYFTPVA